MKKYAEMTEDELREVYKGLEERLYELRSLGLNLNMARGKPSPAQLDLSSGLLDVLNFASPMKASDGTDCRSYGDLEGIPEARKLMADIMEVDPSQVIVFGNSSLNIMYDTVARSYVHGVLGQTPWCKLDEPVKWLSVVPGYDRHFKVTESFGFDLICVPMLETGPDMDLVEELVSSDEMVKGIWCVPKYSNPTGNTYSAETVERLAALRPAAPDFRIYCDDAYTVHHLYEDCEDSLPEILSACEKAGHPDMIFKFASTSKITFPGAGIAAMAASEKNLAWVKQTLSAQTIGHDKINQLRHVRYFGDIEGVKAHMRKHAKIARPKFEAVDEILEKELGGLGIASWTKPHGGYFISFDAMPGTAREIVRLCKETGVVLTGAGATYPYGRDPMDSNIRIAPTFPSETEIRQAMEVFAVCVRIASAAKLLGA